MSLRGKKYWIVGASEGLGRELVVALSKLGVELVISARNEDRLTELASITGAKVLTLDVTNKKAVKLAGESIGPLDGVIYAAGVYTPVNAAAWNANEVEHRIDINFTGAVRVLAAVVPRFVEFGKGHIVIIGSLSGFRGLSGALGYGASKAGIMLSLIHI